VIRKAKRREMESEEYMNRKSRKQRLQRLVYSSSSSSSIYIDRITTAAVKSCPYL
jgi:hypothetical protein